jgi:hypothetical protein
MMTAYASNEAFGHGQQFQHFTAVVYPTAEKAHRPTSSKIQHVESNPDHLQVLRTADPAINLINP